MRVTVFRAGVAHLPTAGKYTDKRHQQTCYCKHVTPPLSGVYASSLKEEMFKLSKSRTTIIIAHLLTTVRHVDKTIILNKGAVVETGTHDCLIELKGHYHNPYTRSIN